MLDKDGKGKLSLTPRSINRMQRRRIDGGLRQPPPRAARRARERSPPARAASGSTAPRPTNTATRSANSICTRPCTTPSRGMASRSKKRLGGRPPRQDQVRRTRFRAAPARRHDQLLDGGVARPERVDDALRPVSGRQEGGDGDAGAGPHEVPAGLDRLVGFYSGANRIPESQLPVAMPKPVTIYDYQVKLKVPLAINWTKAPQHFTNLHMGLQLARRILQKRGGDNKQIFIITDGQPTAHVDGDFVHLLYPPDPRSTVATLKEAVLGGPRRLPHQHLRTDRRLLGHGLGRLRRPADEAHQGRRLLHQQRRPRELHHGELPERPEKENAHCLGRRHKGTKAQRHEVERRGGSPNRSFPRAFPLCAFVPLCLRAFLPSPSFTSPPPPLHFCPTFDRQFS